MPYNPQQNGVTKHKNQSIIEDVKVVTHDQDLPMFLWAEACNKTGVLTRYSKGGIHWCEVRGDSFPHLWFSSLYPCTS